jgi:hemerythrin-like domain-containing protein
MHDKFDEVVRLQREHGGILEAIGDFLDVLDKLDIGSADKVNEVAEGLATLHDNLIEHVKFEEQVILPKLASYAVKILALGVVLEHEEILFSVSELMKQTRYFAEGPSDQTEFGLFQAKFREKMQDIHWVVENHAQTQEVILKLAERTLKQETE